MHVPTSGWPAPSVGDGPGRKARCRARGRKGHPALSRQERTRENVGCGLVVGDASESANAAARKNRAFRPWMTMRTTYPRPSLSRGAGGWGRSSWRCVIWLPMYVHVHVHVWGGVQRTTLPGAAVDRHIHTLSHVSGQNIEADYPTEQDKTRNGPPVHAVTSSQGLQSVEATSRSEEPVSTSTSISCFLGKRGGRGVKFVCVCVCWVCGGTYKCRDIQSTYKRRDIQSTAKYAPGCPEI